MPEKIKCKFCGLPKLKRSKNWQERFGWHICPACWASHVFGLRDEEAAEREAVDFLRYSLRPELAKVVEAA